MKIKLRVALGALLLVALVAASASIAAITSVSGQMELIAPPPSVELGALQSDTTMRAFNERQCVLLDADLTVDINQPGKYNQFSDLPDPKPVIAAGTYVSAHFVHADSISGTQDHPKFFDGSLVTADEILGIAARNDTLNDSDFLGAPGTVYPKAQRGLNFGQNQSDFVLEQTDLHTVQVHAENHLHADQIRVITKCTPPPKKKCKIAGLGILSTNYKAGFAFLVETSKPSGGVLYADKKAGKTLVSTTISAVDLVGSTATIKGTGKVNNSQTVDFTIVATDNGNSGDTFSISWPGYSASGGVEKGGIFVCCP
jgi:hypothetical protein